MLLDGSLLGTIGSGAAIALTTAALRWLVSSRGAPLPRSHDGVSEYRVKPQWQFVGLVGGVFWIVLSIWSWHSAHSRPDPVLTGITVSFVAVGVWLGTGSVTTSQTGITMKRLFSSRSFQWNEIRDVRVHKRDGGAIEVRSGEQKIVADTRFEASQHLLREIETHAQIAPRKVF